MYYLYWIAPIGSSYPKTEGYIGISKHPQARFRDHTTHCETRGSKIVRAYVDEHGIDSVEHTIMNEFNTLEEAKQAERDFRPHSNIGWNLQTGGGTTPDCTGIQLSEETKRKISESNIATKSQRTYTNKFKGTTGRYTEAQKKHIGSFHKGKTISEEHKQAITEKNSGANNHNAKSISIKDSLDDSEYSFDTLKEAADKLGIKYSTLRAASRKGQKLVYKRWILL